MNWQVPLVEIEVTDEDVAAVRDCLRSGWLTMGPRTAAFETAMAERVGTKHAVACSSGTAALHLACKAAGIGPGDEVIVPSTTFVATAHAPRYCGADVVFADIGSREAPSLDIEAVERLIGPRTKAVIAVHMWGYPAPVERLRAICKQQGVALIEDCAEAIGAVTPEGRQAGSVGSLGCFSFFSKKQLAVGEGGIVTTDDDDLAATVRSLRSHAMTSVTWERHRGHGLGYDVTDVGFNYRMDEPRAALALSRIGRLDADIESRRRVARSYRERLADVDGVEVPFTFDEASRGSHFAFPVLVADSEKRDELRAALQARGVQTTWYPAVHSLTEYAGAATNAELPVATEVAACHLTLPIHSLLGDEQVAFVVEQLDEALGQPT